MIGIELAPFVETFISRAESVASFTFFSFGFCAKECLSAFATTRRCRLDSTRLDSNGIHIVMGLGVIGSVRFGLVLCFPTDTDSSPKEAPGPESLAMISSSVGRSVACNNTGRRLGWFGGNPHKQPNIAIDSLCMFTLTFLAR